MSKKDHQADDPLAGLNSDLEKLNDLGQVNDLASSLNHSGLVHSPLADDVGKLAKDTDKLADSHHPSNQLNDLSHDLGDVHKMANDAGELKKTNPLNNLNDLGGDLAQRVGKELNDPHSTLGETGQKNLDQDQDRKKQEPDDPLARLNDLSNLGSLKNQGNKAKGKAGKNNPQKALKGLNALNQDLAHPQKMAKDPLGALNDLSNGLGGNGLFKPLVGSGDQFEDMRAAKQDQRRRPVYRPIHRGPFNKLKDELKKFARRGMDGLKHGFSKATSGLISSVKSVTGKSISKAFAAKAVVAGASMPLIVGGGIAVGVLHNSDPYQVLDDGLVCGVANTNGSGFADAAKATVGSAKLAKHVFYSWVKQGMSGAAAAGTTGFIMGEGGLSIPDKAEGCYENSKKCEIAYGAQPAPDGNPGPDGHSGGGGIYQLTPYSAFARVGDKKWLNVDAQTAFMRKVKIDGAGKGAAYRKYCQYTDPVEACDHWNEFEVGNAGGMSMREACAKKFYEQFHGSSIKADLSLIGKTASSTADDNSATAEAKNNAQCKAEENGGGPVVAGKWGPPYAGYKGAITSPFADTNGRNWHDGIDLSGGTKTIHAIHGGKVVSIDLKGTSQSSMGFFVAVQSPDGYTEVYQEYAFDWDYGKSVTKVKKGDTVKTGQPISVMKTGSHGCTHIHIGVYHGNFAKMMSVGEAHYSEPGYGWVDPVKCIDKGSKN